MKVSMDPAARAAAKAMRKMAMKAETSAQLSPKPRAEKAGSTSSLNRLAKVMPRNEPTATTARWTTPNFQPSRKSTPVDTIIAMSSQFMSHPGEPLGGV